MLTRTVRGILAATALLAAVSASAEAQSRLGATAGIALPMGDFGDVAELGFQVGGQLAMPLRERLGLRFNLDYSRYGIDGADGYWGLLGGVVNLTYDIETTSGLMPYVFGGLGYYNTKLDVDGLGSTDESDVAFNIGAGYNFSAGGRDLFVELRYLSIQTSGDALNTLPIVIGIRF